MDTQFIFDAIKRLDPNGDFTSISYNLSSNNKLGAHWWTMMPYGNWNSPLKIPPVSPFETVLIQSANDAIAQAKSTQSNECFIDLFSLEYSSGTIFNSKATNPDFVKVIADYVNSLPHHVTPVIRYIIGFQPDRNPEELPKGENDKVVNAFFQKDLFNHPKAIFYWGNFSPSIKFSHDAETVATMHTNHDIVQRIGNIFNSIWKWLLNELEKAGSTLFARFKEVIAALLAELRKLEATIKHWIEDFVEKVMLPGYSWNHAKIFAMNGYSLVAGGINYWDLYQSNPPYTVTDLSMYINGGAAVDAHHFANYFWQYLNNMPATDKTSGGFSSPITPSGEQLFEKCTNTPLFGGKGQPAGNMNALSVARNGNWPSHNLGFPVQVIDGVRDILINVLAIGFEKLPAGNVIDLTSWLTKKLSDDNPEFIAILAAAGVNPACWSTRYARNVAIQNATHHVRASQQKFVLDDITQSHGYMAFVAKVNAFFNSHWDGYIWPYDVLVAMSHALSNMSNNDKAQQKGIEIVCSYYRSGWADVVTGTAFKAKLIGIMNGVKALGYITPNGDVDTLVHSLVTYKRINDGANFGNHCKMVLVDEAVCYVGSDNAYPCYNQEFGLWIDDAASIQNFINDYWKGIWEHSKVED